MSRTVRQYRCQPIVVGQRYVVESRCRYYFAAFGNHQGSRGGVSGANGRFHTLESRWLYIADRLFLANDKHRAEGEMKSLAGIQRYRAKQAYLYAIDYCVELTEVGALRSLGELDSSCNFMALRRFSLSWVAASTSSI